MKGKKSMLQSYQFCLTTNKEILGWVLDWHLLWLLLPWTLTWPRLHFWVWPPPTCESCTLHLEGKMLGQAGLQPQFEQMYQWHLQAADTGRLQISTGCICSWRSPWWSIFLGGARAARWRMPVVEDGVKRHFLEATLLPNVGGPMPACSSTD